MRLIDALVVEGCNGHQSTVRFWPLILGLIALYACLHPAQSLELWESIEWLVLLATAIGAVFAGVWSVRQGSDDRKRADELSAEVTELKVDLALMRHEMEQALNTIADHEDRVRGIEKRRRTTK